jgi:hypothetical protein
VVSLADLFSHGLGGKAIATGLNSPSGGFSVVCNGIHMAQRTGYAIYIKLRKFAYEIMFFEGGGGDTITNHLRMSVTCVRYSIWQ